MIAQGDHLPEGLEAKLERMEAIVRRVEDAGSGLTEALRLAEEGIALSAQIEAELSRCDAQVQALLERIRPAEA